MEFEKQMPNPDIKYTGPRSIYDRVCENMAPDRNALPSEIHIRLYEVDPKPYVRDKAFPFEQIIKRDNRTHFYRYGELKRTITKNENDFLVETGLPDDEEGVLICIRDALAEKSNSYFVHGEVINYQGKGILLVGQERSRKTSLLTRFLYDFIPTFIGDEMIRFPKGVENYVSHTPHSVFLRFRDIMNARLQDYMKDISKTQASQYMTQERVNRVFEQELFDINAGIVFSRQRFAEAFRIPTKGSSSIDLIIETNYEPNVQNGLRIERIEPMDLNTHFIQPSKISYSNNPTEELKLQVPHKKVFFENAWEIPCFKLEELLE